MQKGFPFISLSGCQNHLGSRPSPASVGSGIIAVGLFSIRGNPGPTGNWLFCIRTISGYLSAVLRHCINSKSLDYMPDLYPEP